MDFQAGVSYTYSHSLDEQSALGLFYNGNNPLNIRERLWAVGFRSNACIQRRLSL